KPRTNIETMSVVTGIMSIENIFLRGKSKAVRQHKGAVRWHEGAVRRHEAAVRWPEAAVRWHEAAVRWHEAAVRRHEAAVRWRRGTVRWRRRPVIQIQSAVKAGALQKLALRARCGQGYPRSGRESTHAFGSDALMRGKPLTSLTYRKSS